MVSLVLCTWSLQVVVEANMYPQGLAAAQAAVLSMKAAAYSLRNQLSMPLPMPYFHCLVILQNLNFALYSYALCSFESYFTPVLLLVYAGLGLGLGLVSERYREEVKRDD